MIKFFLQKFESGIKDLSGKNSFTQKSIEKADDYLWDVYNAQKEIHRDNGLGCPANSVNKVQLPILKSKLYDGYLHT